jgi:hypothetical protein
MKSIPTAIAVLLLSGGAALAQASGGASGGGASSSSPGSAAGSPSGMPGGAGSNGTPGGNAPVLQAGRPALPPHHQQIPRLWAAGRASIPTTRKISLTGVTLRI